MGKLIDANGTTILDLNKYVVGSATANYTNDNTLYCYLNFSRKISELIISLCGIEGTPRDQITNYYVEYPYKGIDSRACVFIKGGGFISGHKIKINYFAKLAD